jgi:hypothetical protein
MKLIEKDAEAFEPGLGGVVSLEPQPLLHGCKAAPKSQWVMVKALWYRPSDWLEGLRLLWGRFEGKGAIGRRGPFPVASSAETTPPGPGSTVLGSSGGLS